APYRNPTCGTAKDLLSLAAIRRRQRSGFRAAPADATRHRLPPPWLRTSHTGQPRSEILSCSPSLVFSAERSLRAPRAATGEWPRLRNLPCCDEFPLMAGSRQPVGRAGCDRGRVKTDDRETLRCPSPKCWFID